MTLQWLFLDFNSYFASVEQQERPELRNKPVGVVPVMVKSTCCIAASYEAKAFGVTTGTSVAEARLMCPDIQFVQARHDVYVKYHHQLLEAVESCLPIHNVLSIDEMVGRLYGREQEPAEAIKLGRHVKETIYKRVGRYLKCSVGLAPNRYLAKVAGEMQKPDGLTVIESHQLPQVLYKLKLRDLPGIGRNMERRLREHGVRSIETLCAQSDKEMRAIWGGIGGERFAAWLRGEEVDLPATRHRSIGHSHVLEPEFRTPLGSFGVAKGLTAKAALRLRKMGYWTAGFAVSVKMRERARWDRFIKLPEIQDTPTLSKSLEHFWKDFPQNSTPVWIGVTLAPIVPPQQHVLSLFGDDKKERLSQEMDVINEKYGKGTAYFGNLFDVNERTHNKIAFNRVPDLWEF